MRPGWRASPGAGVNLFALRYYLIRAYRRSHRRAGLIGESVWTAGFGGCRQRNHKRKLK